MHRLAFLFKREYWFPMLLLGVFVILVSLQLHGSSLGMYWRYFQGPDQPDPSLWYGSIRPIRSDEYMVSTPWIIAQSQVDFTEKNHLLGNGQSLVLTDSPIINWESIFEPQNWSFFFLPVKYAFAFRWWFRALLLVLAAYILFLEMSKGKWILSAMAAMSILLMPVIQWWYSTTFVEIAAYFLLLLYCFIKMVNYQSTWRLFLWALTLAYFSLCFASLLYVPSLIPAVICLILMMLGMLLNNLRKEKGAPVFFLGQTQNVRQELIPSRIKALFLAFALVLIFDVLIVTIFAIDNRDLINNVTHSAYPGNNRSVGGTLNPSLFLGGFFNITLLNNVNPIPLGPNQSEASSFFALSFFLLPVLLFSTIKSMAKKEPLDYFLVFILLSYMLLLVWSFFDLPSLIRNSLLLNYSSTSRAIIVFGLLNHILIFYYLTHVKISQSLGFVIFSLLYSFAIFCAYFFWVTSLKSMFPNFLSNWNMGIWVSLAVLVMLILLLLQKQLVFWVFFLVFSWVSTFSVNPLYRGLRIILGSELSEAVRNTNEADQGDSLWITYDNLILANYLAANGAHVLNSTQYSPQNELWGKFDPLEEYAQVYNRYAHIVVSSTPDVKKIDFLPVQSDVFNMVVNPCNPKLEEIGVTYYVFTSRVEYACLQRITTSRFKDMSFFIYQRIPSH
ncbi:MAG: hypothetical protein IPO22_19085 [Anaerolineales bacterium]|nr:hypothetical protein [Anaerolineales bacterium]